MPARVSVWCGRALRSRRSLSLVVSIGLHLFVLAPLVGIRIEGNSSTVESPRVLTVTVFQGLRDVDSDGFFSDSAAGDSGDQSATETPALDAAPNNAEPVELEAAPNDAEPVELEAAPNEAEPLDIDTTPNAEPPEFVVETMIDDRPDTPPELPQPATEPPSPPSAEQRIADSAPSVAPIPEPPAAARAPVPSSSSETSATETPEGEPLLTVAEPGSEPAEAIPAPAEPAPPVEQPATIAMAPTERAILEEHVEDWAESFAALSEWQEQTTWIENGKQFNATVAHRPASNSMGLDEAVVTVTTERNGQQMQTSMRMQRLAFSSFAHFVDRWDPNVLVHDDVIDGRFHSNSAILVEHKNGIQPTFLGKVTTAQRVITSQSERRVRREEMFLGGVEQRVDRIVLPKRVGLLAEQALADSERVQRFQRSARIVFAADGSYTWTDVDVRRRRAEPIANAATQRRRLSDEPQILIADEDVRLFVQGTVNGTVLIYSDQGIVIEGNLRYADNPVSSPDSDDYLGLVSERNVEIAPAEITGPGDLTVQAAIYARDYFWVDDSSARKGSGTLFVYGSLTAGSVTATEPRFRTQLNFDPRLAELRPPSFPVTDRYEIADWDGRWLPQ